MDFQVKKASLALGGCLVLLGLEEMQERGARLGLREPEEYLDLQDLADPQASQETEGSLAPPAPQDHQLLSVPGSQSLRLEGKTRSSRTTSMTPEGPLCPAPRGLQGQWVLQVPEVPWGPLAPQDRAVDLELQGPRAL